MRGIQSRLKLRLRHLFVTEFLRVNSTDLEQISNRIPLCKFNRFGSNWWQIFILYREIFWHQIESQSVGTSNRFLNRFWWIQQNLVKNITRMCNRFSLIWCQQLYQKFNQVKRWEVGKCVCWAKLVRSMSAYHASLSFI